MHYFEIEERFVKVLIIIIVIERWSSKNPIEGESLISYKYFTLAATYMSQYS